MSSNTWLSWCLDTFIQPRLIFWHTVELLALTLLGLTIIRVLLYIAASVVQTNRLLSQKKAESIPLDSQLRSLIGKVGIEPTQIIIVDSPRLELYCAGFLRPKVIISTSITAQLTELELESALRHEQHHAHVRHGLILLIAEVAREAFWFLPITTELVRYARYRAEVAADKAAGGSSNPNLRSALQKLLNTTQPAWQPAFSGTPAQARIETLLSGKIKGISLSRRALIKSLVMMILAISLAGVICLEIPHGDSGFYLAGENNCTQPLFTPNSRV